MHPSLVPSLCGRASFNFYIISCLRTGMMLFHFWHTRTVFWPQKLLAELFVAPWTAYLDRTLSENKETEL